MHVKQLDDRPKLLYSINPNKQQIEQVVTLPNINIDKLTAIYNKFQEFKKFDQIDMIDNDFIETFKSIIEIDWTLPVTSIQQELECKKQKLPILNENTEKRRYAIKIGIDAVKEFKNLQPLLPDIIQILNLVIYQTQFLNNILNRGRGEWFRAEIEQSTDKTISLEQLYANYKMYCTAHKEIAVIKSVFGKDFLDMANCFEIDPIKSRNKDGVFFRGVQFRPGVELAPRGPVKKRNVVKN